MKKAVLLMVVMLLASFSVVIDKTMIAGTIYDANFKNTIVGATVRVNCNGHIQNLTSAIDDGAYSAIYVESDCESGDFLDVFASHPEYGANSVSGIIHEDMVLDWDIGIVNVPLVPEFGMFIGALTILSALGVFFIVRKE